MEFKEKYTISEATELLGFKSRSTINKRTKVGGKDSISFEKDEYGNKVIRLVELQRVFPDRMKNALANKENTPNTISAHGAKIQASTRPTAPNTVLLQQKVEMLEAQLEQEQAERLRERREANDRDNKADNREHLLQQQHHHLPRV